MEMVVNRSRTFAVGDRVIDPDFDCTLAPLRACTRGSSYGFFS